MNRGLPRESLASMSAARHSGITQSLEVRLSR
jgi:hypothetical protein